MPGNGSRVSRDDALEPLVLALDVGSTASRGDVYDAAGRPVQGGRRECPTRSAPVRTAQARSTRTRWSTSSDRSSPAWPSSRCRAASPAWRSTRSPPRWSGSTPTGGLSPPATPTPTPGAGAGGGPATRARRGGGAAAHRLPAAQQLPPRPAAMAAGDRPGPVRRGPTLAVAGRVRLPAPARVDGRRHRHGRMDGSARPPHRALGPGDARHRRDRDRTAVGGA